MQLHNEVAALYEKCVGYRQDLHRIPELGFNENKTHNYIADRLRALSPDKIEVVAGTGLKAVWYAAGAAETIAFRADMDGLEMEEDSENAYASVYPDRMHGCGHDGHMTMLLLLAELIARFRDKLKFNAVLLFQPGEEGWGGASRLVAEGVLENPQVNRIYGIHLWPDIPKGKIGIRWGTMMAQSCEFDITAHGLSAHGASPQLGVDAVVASAAFISMFQSAITRSLDPHHDAILTIGRICGGTTRNTIADRVEMNATLRVMSSEVYDQLMSRIHAMARGVAVATGAEFEISEKMRYPSVNNPRPMVEHFYNYLDMSDVVLVEPVMAAEDFACYQQIVPGLFIFLGVGGGKNNHPLHNSCFDFDEDALLYGVEVFRRLLELE